MGHTHHGHGFCDITCLPHRLEKQHAFRRAHPEVGLCGASIHRADEVLWPLPEPLREGRVMTNHEAFQAELSFRKPFYSTHDHEAARQGFLCI